MDRYHSKSQSHPQDELPAGELRHRMMEFAEASEDLGFGYYYFLHDHLYRGNSVTTKRKWHKYSYTINWISIAKDWRSNGKNRHYSKKSNDQIDILRRKIA